MGASSSRRSWRTVPSSSTSTSRATASCSASSSKCLRCASAGRGDDRRALQRLRHHRGGEADPLVELVLHLVELVADEALLLAGELRLAHQALDEVAIAEVGGHAAGGDVRLVDQAVLLQGRELVAHGGGGVAGAVDEGKLVGELLGGDRLGGADMFFDERAQDGFLARAELAVVPH